MDATGLLSCYCSAAVVAMVDLASLEAAAERAAAVPSSGFYLFFAAAAVAATASSKSLPAHAVTPAMPAQT